MGITRNLFFEGLFVSLYTPCHPMVKLYFSLCKIIFCFFAYMAQVTNQPFAFIVTCSLAQSSSQNAYPFLLNICINRLALLRSFPASFQMIIHHATGLHKGIANGGAHKGKTPLQQVFAHGIG